MGSCVSAYSCDHGSHGRLWCMFFVEGGPFLFDAQVCPCRELPPSPDYSSGGPRVLRTRPSMPILIQEKKKDSIGSCHPS